MAPNQAEYQRFLQVAIERLTVGTLPLPMCRCRSDLYRGVPEGSLRKQIPSHRQCVSGIKGM